MACGFISWLFSFEKTKGRAVQFAQRLRDVVPPDGSEASRCRSQLCIRFLDEAAVSPAGCSVRQPPDQVFEWSSANNSCLLVGAGLPCKPGPDCALCPYVLQILFRKWRPSFNSQLVRNGPGLAFAPSGAHCLTGKTHEE